MLDDFGRQELETSVSTLPLARTSPKFCGECGQQLRLVWLPNETLARFTCVGCGTVHYQNPKVLVTCYIHFRDQVLFCRRAEPPAFGLWAPPGGYVECEESLEAACAREVYEETGLSLDKRHLALFRLVSLPHISQVYVEFRCELGYRETPRPGPEALEVEWFSAADLPRDRLAFSNKDFILADEFFRCVEHGTFPVSAIVVESPFTSRGTACAQS